MTPNIDRELVSYPVRLARQIMEADLDSDRIKRLWVRFCDLAPFDRQICLAEIEAVGGRNSAASPTAVATAPKTAPRPAVGLHEEI